MFQYILFPQLEDTEWQPHSFFLYASISQATLTVFSSCLFGNYILFYILYFFSILPLSLSTRMSSRTTPKDHSSPLPVVRGSNDCYYAKYANRFKPYSSVTRASLERCGSNVL